MTDSSLNQIFENGTTLNSYADWTDTTAVYPESGEGSKLEMSYLALGLNGEAGEVAEKIKKYLRGDLVPVSSCFETGRSVLTGSIEKELGDVLWYWCRLCKCFGLSPTAVMERNMQKLNKRKAEDKLKGSGDSR